jgi:CNT family concentrative nucleoside transporter
MYLQSLGGLCILTGIAWLLSEHRRHVRLRTIVVGLALQLLLAALLLKLSIFQEAFLNLNRVIQSLEEATRAGTSFVFGFLGGGPVPFQETSPEHSFVLAFRALPLVLVMSALSSVLFYWGLLPLVVKAFSRVLQRSMGIGGAVGVGAAANIFVGMVEAPLLVRPYLNRMTRSELFVIMTCGMATVAGDPRCHRSYPDGLPNQCTGGDHGRPDHGPGTR